MFFISDVYADIKGRTSEIFSRSTIFIWQVGWEAVVTIDYMTANHRLIQTQGSTQELYDITFRPSSDWLSHPVKKAEITYLNLNKKSKEWNLQFQVISEFCIHSVPESGEKDMGVLFAFFNKNKYLCSIHRSTEDESNTRHRRKWVKVTPGIFKVSRWQRRLCV